VSGPYGDPPSKVRVRLAPERSGDASRPGSEAQNGLASAAARGEGLRQWALFCRLIRTGWAPIYRREINLLVADAETNSILSPI
jgi:hypothetical protein